MQTAIKVEDLLSMQVFIYKNLKSAIESPDSPIDQSYRRAQQLKAENGYPFLMDGCRVSEVNLLLCVKFDDKDYRPASEFEGDFQNL